MSHHNLEQKVKSSFGYHYMQGFEAAPEKKILLLKCSLLVHVTDILDTFDHLTSPISTMHLMHYIISILVILKLISKI